VVYSFENCCKGWGVMTVGIITKLFSVAQLKWCKKKCRLGWRKETQHPG